MIYMDKKDGKEFNIKYTIRLLDLRRPKIIIEDRNLTVNIDGKENLMGRLTFHETGHSKEVDIIRNPLTTRHTLTDFYNKTITNSSVMNTIDSWGGNSTNRADFMNFGNFEDRGKLSVKLKNYVNRLKELIY